MIIIIHKILLKITIQKYDFIIIKYCTKRQQSVKD